MRIYIETISLLELQILYGKRLVTQTYDEEEFNKKVKPFLTENTEYTDNELAEIARDKGCFHIRREWSKEPPRTDWGQTECEHGGGMRDWSDQRSIY